MCKVLSSDEFNYPNVAWVFLKNKFSGNDSRLISCAYPADEQFAGTIVCFLSLCKL